MNSKELFAEVAKKADTPNKPIDAAVTSRVCNTMLDEISNGIKEGKYGALEVVNWFAKELDKRSVVKEKVTPSTEVLKKVKK